MLKLWSHDVFYEGAVCLTNGHFDDVHLQLIIEITRLLQLPSVIDKINQGKLRKIEFSIEGQAMYFELQMFLLIQSYPDLVAPRFSGRISPDIRKLTNKLGLNHRGAKSPRFSISLSLSLFLSLSLSLTHTHKNPTQPELTFYVIGKVWFTFFIISRASQAGNNINATKSVRDLGILLSDDCSWTPHVMKTSSEARRMAAWALRAFKDRSVNTMLTLYKSLIRCPNKTWSFSESAFQEESNATGINFLCYREGVVHFFHY
eukprot:sb/3468454/